MLMMRKSYKTGQSREDFAQQVNSSLQAFYDRFEEQKEYVSYFQKRWGQKTGNLL